MKKTDKMSKWFKKLTENIFLRNIVLAVCSVIVFVFLVTIGLSVFTRHNKYKVVPDFEGMSMGDVALAADKASLKVEVIDSLYVPAFEGGVVLDQTPAAGTNVKEGRRIFLTINASTQRKVRVPYVTGYSLRQAKNNLEVAGLGIEKLIYRSDMATNYVLEERYGNRTISADSNIEVEMGSGITLVVGMGRDAKPVAVPNIMGFKEREAYSRLWELGLNVGKVVCDPDITNFNRHEAVVYEQDPLQARYLNLGQAVDIKLTLDKEKADKNSSQSKKEAERLIEQRLKEQAANN